MIFQIQLKQGYDCLEEFAGIAISSDINKTLCWVSSDMLRAIVHLFNSKVTSDIAAECIVLQEYLVESQCSPVKFCLAMLEVWIIDEVEQSEFTVTV